MTNNKQSVGGVFVVILYASVILLFNTVVSLVTAFILLLRQTVMEILMGPEPEPMRPLRARSVKRIAQNQISGDVLHDVYIPGAIVTYIETPPPGPNYQSEWSRVRGSATGESRNSEITDADIVVINDRGLSIDKARKIKPLWAEGMKRREISEILGGVGSGWSPDTIKKYTAAFTAANAEIESKDGDL